MVELALACLHKLVAHAWLHGESTAAGTMDILSAHGSLDDDDTVANVIKIVIKCGETTNEAQQLAVVRALLTFTTAGGWGGRRLRLLQWALSGTQRCGTARWVTPVTAGCWF